MNEEKRSDDVIQIPESEDIELRSPSELGLDSAPGRGDPCSYEGEYTCGRLKLVLKCVGGKWRSTNRSC